MRNTPGAMAWSLTARRVTAGAAALAAVFAATIWAAQATAQAVPTEVTRFADAEVTLYLHPFLTDNDRMLLEIMASNEQTLQAFLGEGGGHAAMALAPAEGLMQGDAPAASATAVGQLPDAETARSRALEECDAARSGGAACVVVIEVAPTR